MRAKTALSNTTACWASANASLLSPRVQTVATTALFVAAAAFPAFAQDTIGITPVATAAIAGFKVLGLIGIGYGFIRLMGGRHTVEGLVCMGIGGLGLAKSDAVAALFGIG